MNSDSSKSHIIFELIFKQINNTTKEIQESQIYLVDLAGSENIIKIKSKDKIFCNESKINISLSLLYELINDLSDIKLSLKPNNYLID